MNEKMKKALPFVFGGGVLLLITLYFLWPGSALPGENAGDDTAITGEPEAITLADSGPFTPVAPSAIGDLTIEPTLSTDRGVSTQSDFIIKTQAAVSREDLLQYLSVKSGETFTLEEKGSQEFTLSFSGDLKADTLYNLVYTPPQKHPLSYAFQTEKGFGVTGTMPANEAGYIPINSGIEIYFNEKVDLDFTNYFSILPEVKGSFEVLENRVIFQPDQSLEYDMNYTVTLKEGLTSLDKEQLKEDYSFSFSTQWESYSGTRFTAYGRAYEAFLPSDTLYFELSMEDALIDSTFSVDIFSVPSPMDYINACSLGDRVVTLPDSASLLTSLETEVVVVSDDNYWYDRKYLFLEEELPPGYYIAEIKTVHSGETYSLRQCFQITELSVYSLSLEGEMCFWINDTITGGPAAGATVHIDGKEVTADRQGLARLAASEKANPVIRVSYGEHPDYVYKTYTYETHEMNPHELYFSYIYTDRSAYKPTDTIDVFGVIRPRYEEYPLTGEEEIFLTLGDMKSVPVTPDKHGAFAVTIPINDLKGYVLLNLMMGGTYLNGTSLQCLDYAKERYLIDASPEEPLYFNNSDASFLFNVTAYDNTPVEGVTLTGPDNVPFATDETGGAVYHTRISKTPYEYVTPYGAPERESYYFTLTGQEEYVQSVYTPVTVLHSDVMIQKTTREEGGFTFSSNKIDIASLRALILSGESYFAPEDYMGAAIDMDFSIDVYKTIYTREETGSRYDYIKKVTVPTYKYSDKDVFVGTFYYNTADGVVDVTDLPSSSNPMEYHWGKINFTDTRGADLTYRVSLDTHAQFRSGYGESSLSFRLEREGSENSWEYSLGLGEQGIIKLEDYGQGSDAVFEGDMLLIATKNKLLDIIVGDAAGIPLTYEEDYIGGIALFGAYFDGQYVYPVQYAFYLSYDYSEKELHLTMENDKEQYQPGDKVTTTVKVTDQSGRPKQALVNLSVVDEAAFSLYSNDAYFLPGFYNSLSFNAQPYHVHSSHSRYDYSEDGNMGAEKGGGGDDYAVRDDFRENPAFLSLETDKNGVAEFTYDLADNVTRWRLTAHAISKDNSVGDERHHAIATLPYYIDFIMLNEFVTGDDLSVIVKPGGESFKLGGDLARYSLEISKDGDGDIIYTDTSSDLKAVTFIAEGIKEGEYRVLVKSDYGEYSDAMAETVTITEASLLVPMVHEQKLTETAPTLADIPALSSPVNLTLSNGDTRLLLNTLYSTRVYQSTRTDERAAYAYTDYYLGMLQGREVDELSYINQIKNDLYWYNGISELIYGSADLEFTARFAGTFPETIDKEYLVQYVLENSGMYEDANIYVRGSITPEYDRPYDEMLRGAGYFALASAGENVLPEIYDQLEIIRNNSAQEVFRTDFHQQMRVLYYAAALCVLGDDTGAYDLLKDYPPTPETDYYAEFINTMLLYINATIDPVAAYTYLEEKDDNQFVSDVLEKIHFIRQAMPKSAAPSEFSYKLNGSALAGKLENFDILTLDITKEQLLNLNLKQLKGSTAVHVEYKTTVDHLDTAKQTIQLSKNIQPNTQSADTNRHTVSFTITMPKDAPTGIYTIVDRVPSNMRFANQKRQASPYAFSDGGQAVTIYFSYTEKNDPVISASYDVIKVSDATAVVGPAYVGARYNTRLWGVSQ